MRRESRAFSRVGRSVLGGVSAFILYLFGSMGACEKLVPIETFLVKESFGMIVFKSAFEECTDIMERSRNYMMFENQTFA